MIFKTNSPLRSACLCAAMACVLGAAAPATAQFIGPGAQPVLTDVASVLERPIDDQRVRLTGRLVQQISSDKYLFSDGTRQIRVEIDELLMPSTPFGPDTPIVLEGEVEKDFLESPEIDVDRLVLKP